MGKFIDLTGQQFGDWKVEYYAKDSYWLCRNIKTNETKSIHSYSLRTQYSNYTKINKRKPKNDLTGQTFGEWTVLEYIGNSRYKCKCSCGGEGIVLSTNLIKGNSTRCNSWKHCIKDDLSGRTFGNIEVIEYTGEHNKWRCKCLVCGNENFITHRDTIVNLKAKSCGCLKEKLRAQTLLERYGDTNTTRINNPREDWQREALESKEAFDKIINNNPNITVTDLAIILGINEAYTTKILRKYGHEDIINEYNGVSSIEISLRNFIESFGYEIETSNRKILKGKELDIYIPELNLAFEFNGDFWHSHLFKDKNYHQEKSMKCSKENIRLIHIFEYEWRKQETREKIEQYISNILSKENKIVYARNTIIKNIDSTVTKEFLNKYHLQGYASASINLGCYDNETEELIGVMTFGNPRFSDDAEYEIIRLCWKSNTRIIGGAEKLFKHFIEKYKPKSISTYTDFAKFTGQVYTRLGFKENGISDPGYVWIRKNDYNILHRYQTQKHKLLEQGLGKFGNTEDEIMENLGYFKIYNSGNLKFIWTLDNK